MNWPTARWHLWSQSFKAIHCNSRITPPPFSSTDIFVEEKRGGVILLWQLMALIDWLHRCQLAGFMTHCLSYQIFSNILKIYPKKPCPSSDGRISDSKISESGISVSAPLRFELRIKMYRINMAWISSWTTYFRI